MLKYFLDVWERTHKLLILYQMLIRLQSGIMLKLILKIILRFERNKNCHGLFIFGFMLTGFIQL